MAEKDQQLIREALKFIDARDEEGLRKFLVDNLRQFSEDIQRDIIGFFFEEAVNDTYQTLNAQNAFYKDVLDTYKGLLELKRMLEDRIKELELKGEIENMS